MKLTRSQAASLLSVGAAFLVTLNQHLPELQAIGGVRLPPDFVMAVQVAGWAIPVFCRSLLPANSGKETVTHDAATEN